jgi:hypothetical protein
MWEEIAFMKAKKNNKHKASQKLTVKKPATLRDYVRIYRIKNGLLREAKKLVQEELCSAT